MLDIARFYGIVLVYYGHIVEQVMYLGNVSAAAQYKYIYSFHMPFFFLLSGFVANPTKQQQPIGRFLKYQSASRLIPYLFFSALLFIAFLFLPGWFPLLGDLKGSQSVLFGWVITLQGLPAFNVPLWFLIMLFVTEFLHYLVGRRLDSDLKLLVAVLALYLFGYYLNLDITFFSPKQMLQPNLWLWNETPISLAFYLLGVLLRRRGWLLADYARWVSIAGAVVCAVFVLVTYDLNQGPFRYIQAVTILLSGHGHVLWFPVTAVVGSLLLVWLAKTTGENRWLAWLGENTFILFCLNGVFYHFLNPPFAKWYVAHFSSNGWAVFMAVSLATVASLVLCLPCIWFFRGYLPQLTGRPAARGPWLGALVGR